MSARLSLHFASRAAEYGLSAAEAKVLLALDPAAPLPMRALARNLGYDASNLTGIIDRLEDRGAVERRSDSADRRIKTIAPTGRGRRLGDQLGQRLRADAGPVTSLTHSELRDLRRLLQRAMDTDSPA